MRKLINYFVTAICVVMMTFTVTHAEISIPDPSSEFYVNDFAEIFSESEKEEMVQRAKTLSDENDGIQVVVTTIKSLEGNSIDDYAYEMYNQYGIGKNDMGLLILLATEDRQIRIEVGKAMEAYFNDSKAGRFIDDYAIPYLIENKFNEGLIVLQEELIKEIVLQVEKEEANIDKGDEPKKEANTTKESEPEIESNKTFLFLIITIAFASLFLVCIFIAYIIKQKKEEEARKKYEEEERRRAKERERLLRERERQKREAEESYSRRTTYYSQRSSDYYGDSFNSRRMTSSSRISSPTSNTGVRSHSDTVLTRNNVNETSSKSVKDKEEKRRQEEARRKKEEQERREEEDRRRREEEDRRRREDEDRRRREEEDRRRREEDRRRREEEDRRRREEEDRRRREDERRRSQSSGFGGHSGGGGARRGF